MYGDYVVVLKNNSTSCSQATNTIDPRVHIYVLWLSGEHILGAQNIEELFEQGVRPRLWSALVQIPVAEKRFDTATKTANKISTLLLSAAMSVLTICCKERV